MLLLGRSCSISFGNKLSSHTVNLCQTELPEGRATIQFTDGKLKHLYRREFLFIFVLAEQNPSAPERKHHMCSLCHSSQRSSINIIYFKTKQKKLPFFSGTEICAPTWTFYLRYFMFFLSFFPCYFLWCRCELEISVWLFECKMSRSFSCRLKIKGHVKLKCYSFSLALNSEISTFLYTYL